APNFDAVVLAGDHLDISSAVDGRTQIVVVLAYLERIARRTRLMVCSGNHDLDSRAPDGEKGARWVERLRGSGIGTDGDGFAMGDTLFTICPWWDGPLGQERIAAQLARDAARPKARWVWVHHAPPEGSIISREHGRSFGDAALAGWITQYHPDLVF